MDGQCTVTINGKTVGLKFNRYAIEQGTAVKGSGSLYKNTIALMWGGIQGNAFAKQIEPDVTFEEIVDWVDQIEFSGDETGEILKITEAFQSSLIYKKLVVDKPEKADAEQANEEKKSNNLTTSDSYLRAS